MDRFTQEIIQDAIVAVGQEMFNAMIRTSMSPIIYESKDFAVGATDATGNLLAQGNGVTAFLATLDTAVQGVLERYPEPGQICPGDVFITNIPYAGGGSHLSDVVIVNPVFDEDALIAFTVNKAHWTEVGGASPGSVSTHATEIYQEGLQFDFLKLYQAGVLNEAIVAIIRSNVRLPDSTIGDMHAGVAAARVGAQRILELVERYSHEGVLAAMSGLLDYGEQMMRAELSRLPAGEYFAEDIVEDDGLGNGPFTIKVKVTITDRELIADYTGTSPQTEGPINCSFTGLVTGARCIFKAITNPDVPANGGAFRALKVICPPGTLLSAQAPASVSIYYESLIAAIDVMWKALAPVVPERLTAGHQRSVNATFISGIHPKTQAFFVMGEPLVGGWGASPRGDGDNGQFCCGNGETYNIPIELFESRYGLRVTEYAFNTAGTAGAGEFRGGLGVSLAYEVTAQEAWLTYAATRTEANPWGLAGGDPGSLNYAEVIRADGSVERHTMCTTVSVKRGETIRLVSAGGGGYGDPGKRAKDAIVSDLANDFLTPAQAAELYGFAVQIER